MVKKREKRGQAKLVLVCEVCNGEARKFPCQLKKTKHIFCSAECYHKSGCRAVINTDNIDDHLLEVYRKNVDKTPRSEERRVGKECRL